MRQETNNEMDLLLRRLSRRQDASMPHADHLDADELSAYAENALPAAARARYTEHLADCSQCRKLVVQLGSAAGFAPAIAPATVVEASGLRKFLASLLSPMVLRYAVPALGLIVVAAIGFVVLRQRQGADGLMARVEPQPPPTAPVSLPEQEKVASSETPSRFNDEQEKSEAQRGQPKAERDASAKEAEVTPPPPNAAPVVNVNTEVKKSQEAPVPLAKAESQTVANAAPSQPAPKPTPETATDEWRVEAEGRRQATQGRAAPGSVARERTADSVKSTDQRGDLAGAGAKARGLQRDGTEDKDDADTRVIAGRRFRKQRGVWVDTAYNSGQTVNLTRGSEQYRALVADEPAIKRIADELDGEIIVVWKSRTYKIQ